jgi:uncharacterized RDD family membrane protein YckC
MGLRLPPSGLTDRTAPLGGIAYAGWLRRFGAAFLDALLISMINYLLGGILSFTPSPLTSTAITLVEVISLLSVIAILYATLCLDRLHGQTPGMRLLQIRCIPVAGHGRISTSQAVVRSVSAVVLTTVPWFLAEWIPAIWVLVVAAYLWPLVDSRRQTWWDHLANTIVVNDRSW